MPTPIPYARAVAKAQSFESYGSQPSCCVVEEDPTCLRFTVEKQCVCLTFWGLEGRTFALQRLRLDCAGKVLGMVPYPVECPFLTHCDGAEFIMTKPGTYEVCTTDGEPLPKNFELEQMFLSDKQMMANRGSGA